MSLNLAKNRLVNNCRCGACKVCILFARRERKNKQDRENNKKFLLKIHPTWYKKEWLEGYDGPTVPTSSMTAFFIEYMKKYRWQGILTRGVFRR